MPHTFLPQNGSYRALRVYKITEIIYDYTFFFVQHYKEKGDRTIDQMVQAARSGKQNIAEGNQAAATSSETEIKLTNVAKASLEELLLDYSDYSDSLKYPIASRARTSSRTSGVWRPCSFIARRNCEALLRSV